MRPVRAKALLIAQCFKAFALTGRQVSVHNHPGRCPGLGASAPSGRVATIFGILEASALSLGDRWFRACGDYLEEFN